MSYLSMIIDGMYGVGSSEDAQSLAVIEGSLDLLEDIFKERMFDTELDLYVRCAYENAYQMLKYALNGDYDCLRQFKKE